MLQRPSLGCLLITLLVAGRIAAQQDDRGPASDVDQIQRWLKMDKDGDGRLNNNETTGFTLENFDAIGARRDH